MPGQIFYRERQKAKDGAKTPRYRIVAVSGVDLKVYAGHLRKTELEQIANATQADLVALKRGPKHLASRTGTTKL
jgi:nucleotide-binding universal stress UspA family protein